MVDALHPPALTCRSMSIGPVHKVLGRSRLAQRCSVAIGVVLALWLGRASAQPAPPSSPPPSAPQPSAPPPPAAPPTAAPRAPTAAPPGAAGAATPPSSPAAPAAPAAG